MRRPRPFTVLSDRNLSRVHSGPWGHRPNRTIYAQRRSRDSTAAWLIAVMISVVSSERPCRASNTRPGSLIQISRRVG